MGGSESAAEKWINLYNSDDLATSFAWKMNNLSKYYVNRAVPEEPDFLSAHIIDNESLLPPPEVWPWRYVVEKDGLGENDYYRVPYTTADVYIQDRTQWTNMTPKLRDTNDKPGEWAYEIIAFTSHANAAPVGTEPVGWFGVNTDINSLGLTTDASKPHLHPDIQQNHSFQFHHDAAATWPFWLHIKAQTGFNASY